MECGRCRAALIHISIEFRQNCVHKCIQDILGTLRNRTVPWYAITSSNFGIKVSNTSECLKKKRNYSITVLLFDDNSSMSIWTSSNAILHNTICHKNIYKLFPAPNTCIYILYQQGPALSIGKEILSQTRYHHRPQQPQILFQPVGCNKHHEINIIRGLKTNLFWKLTTV